MPFTKELNFWKGFSLYRLEYFLSRCKKEVFFDLLNGETKKLHLDLKDFPEHKIFSIRLNRKDRLLFTVVDGYILFLEFIDEHDYQKSIYLKPGNLTALLQKHTEETHQFINTKDFYSTYSDEIESVATDSHDSLEPVYFCFSQTEEDYSYPILINGAAGSGKTTWLRNHLEKELLKMSSDPKKVLYLSQSPEKVRAYFLRKLGEEVLEGVNFLTYSQFLEKHFQVSPMQLVTMAHCEQWYETYSHLPRYKKFFKAQSLEKVLEEFAIIAFNESGYLSLGMRACLFHQVEERSFVLQAYKDFGKFLHDKKLIYPALFYSELHEPVYDYVFVDNAEDFFPITLKILAEMNTTAHFAFAIDSAGQGLKIDSYIQLLLKERLMTLKLKADITSLSLEKTYHVSQKIIDFASKVLDVKEEVVGKSERPLIHCEGAVGDVFWESNYPDTAKGFVDYVKRLQKQVKVLQKDILIVVSPNLMPEFLKFDLQALLPNIKVRTPIEAKKLNFSVVIYWRPFDNSAVYSQLNRFMGQFADALADKKPMASEFSQAFGDLYALSMRAKKCLVFMQSDSHTCHYLVDSLKENLPSLTDREELSAVPMSLVPAKTTLGNYHNRLFAGANAIESPLPLRAACTA